MRAAAVQLNSTADTERNLATAERLTRAAAGDGAQLVVLPEKFNVLGTERSRIQCFKCHRLFCSLRYPSLIIGGFGLLEFADWLFG